MKKIVRNKNEFFIPIESLSRIDKLSQFFNHVPFMESYGCYYSFDHDGNEILYLQITFTLSKFKEFSSDIYCDYVIDKFGDSEEAYETYHKIPFFLYPYRVIKTLYLKIAHKGFYAPLE